jgi:hypothetical protein
LPKSCPYEYQFRVDFILILMLLSRSIRVSYKLQLCFRYLFGSFFTLAAFGGGLEAIGGDPLLHLPDARLRTPPKGLLAPWNPY